MARKTIVQYVSDLTGQPITQPATIRLTVGTQVWTADLDASEPIVNELKAKGRPTKKRGRKTTK
jgi:hypothetical protein